MTVVCLSVLLFITKCIVPQKYMVSDKHEFACCRKKNYIRFPVNLYTVRNLRGSG